MPSLTSVSAAAAGVDFPANTDFRVSITNAPGSGAYPISSFTWLLIRPDMADEAKARGMKQFLTWMVTPEAGKMAADLQYAPLPDPVIALVKQRIAGLKANGKVLE